MRTGLSLAALLTAALLAAEPAAEAPRHRPYRPGELRFDPDTDGTIVASVYSLPSSFFGAGEAAAFLAAVRALDRGRDLLVLADPPLRRELAGRAGELGVELLDTDGRSFSPWPRDPFSLVRDREGRVVALARPNAQPGREGDAAMAAELVASLPPRLDAGWGGAAWAEAHLPFHNGQVLLTREVAWVSLHTLEPHVLRRLGLARVPVESFATPEGIDRYLAGAREAAAELAALWGRPVRFVHPLPVAGAATERSARMRALGGGAGFDLDSLVTLLPAGPGGERALVASVEAGRELLARLRPDDWRALRRVYGLAPPPERLPAALASVQAAPRPAALAGYLDLVAGHLAAEGFAVARLPLLFVPVALLADREGLSHPDFLLTWNNVVVERRDGRPRAEGFASLLPTADAEARAAFARQGVALDLLPPLVRSVVLNGGYRCASNHLRRPPGEAAPAGVLKLRPH